MKGENLSQKLGESEPKTGGSCTQFWFQIWGIEATADGHRVHYCHISVPGSLTERDISTRILHWFDVVGCASERVFIRFVIDLPKPFAEKFLYFWDQSNLEKLRKIGSVNKVQACVCLTWILHHAPKLATTLFQTRRIQFVVNGF